MIEVKGNTDHQLEYEKPVLTTLGRVRDLTAAGSMGGSEFMAGVGSMPDVCDRTSTNMTADCFPWH